MNRRHFSQLTGTALAALTGNSLADHHGEKKVAAFKSKFGPHPGLLATGPGKKADYIDQLKFAHDHGFRGWEDNHLNSQPAAVQEKIGEFMKDTDMEIGISVIFFGGAMQFNELTAENKVALKKDMLKGVEVAKRTGQTVMTMLPGVRDESMTREAQIKASVDGMKFCCDLIEEHDLIMVNEPLSHGIKGGEPLLRSFEDGHMLCELVNRKSCKLLADYYHEGQIGHGEKFTEITNKVWDQIAYVQYGASPGRKEPGTGKLDYVTLTKQLREKGYSGVIGMEHGASKKGKEGLDALVAAYRKIDA